MKKTQTIAPQSDLLEHFLGEEVTLLSNIQEIQQTEDGEPVTGLVGYRGILLDFDTTWVLLGGLHSGEPFPSVLLKKSAIVGVQLSVQTESDSLPDTISNEMN